MLRRFTLLVVLVLLCQAAAGMARDQVRPTPDADQKALLAAARHGDSRTVRRLLAEGVAVDSRDNGFWTPLLWASAYLHADTVRILIAHGADLEAVGRAGKNSGTPLMWAAKKPGGLAVARILLEAGAAVNGTDQYGRTALMMAARHGRSEAIAFLLARGADINAINLLPRGRTALEIARKYGGRKIVRLLRRHGALDWEQLPEGDRARWAAAQTRGRRGPLGPRGTRGHARPALRKKIWVSAPVCA